VRNSPFPVLALVATASLCALPNGPCRAATPVGGLITGSTTWSAEQSPYVTTENVEVAAGSTLTIAPGTEIHLTGRSFVVKGTLIARGTEAAPIRFTTAQTESPQPGQWGYLLFEGAAASGNYNQALKYVSGSILEHAIVEYGQGLFFNAAAPYVTHCTIQHNRKERGGGIYIHGCNPLIRDSRIANNVALKEGGGVRSVYSKPILIGNTITLNAAGYNGGGFSMDHNSVRLENNTFSHNFAAQGGAIAAGETQVGQTSLTGVSTSTPQIVGNKILNNTAGYAGGGISVEGSPVISRNVIAGNRIHYTQVVEQPSNEAMLERKSGAGAGIKVVETYGGIAAIEQNVIAGNRGAFWGAAMCFDRASGKVQRNHIYGNQASLQGAAISILVRSSSKSFIGKGHGSDWLVQENEIAANSQGVFELAMARFGGEQSIRVNRCNLAENEGTLFVNGTANEVICHGNWWGTVDKLQIATLIHDAFDNRQLGQVRTSPADGRLPLEGLPEIAPERLSHLANYPTGLRAGQGFGRIPGTPPSVTLTWSAGDIAEPAGYLIYFSKIEPEFGKIDLRDNLRIAAKCLTGPSPIDVGNATRTTLEGFEIGTTYEFYVTAYDNRGEESAGSDPFVVKVER
jgi:hypothetical protein